MSTLLASLVYPILAGAGAVLALAPLVIHLMMRSKPRRVVFPAMRFVKLTHNAGVRRHRLKHLLLLLMRMAAIAILALVLARPKIKTSAGLSPGTKEPVSAVLIIDTSGSMAYRVAGRTRLEDAQRLATRLLEQLPAGSRAAVIWPDRPGDTVKLADPSSAVAEVRALTDRPTAGDSAEPSAADGPRVRVGQRANMIPLLSRAVGSLAHAATPRREIYVFNDRTRDSWLGPTRGTPMEKTDIPIYLVDVGAASNQNFLLASADWNVSMLSPYRDGRLACQVHPGELAGPGTKRVISLQMQGPDEDEPQTVAAQEVDLPAKLSPVSLAMKWSPTRPGLYTGRVFIEGDDEITEDNTRYLAMEVGPLPTVLVIESQSAGERPGVSVAGLVEATLAPRERVADGTAQVDLARVPAADFLSAAPQEPGTESQKAKQPPSLSGRGQGEGATSQDATSRPSPDPLPSRGEGFSVHADQTRLDNARAVVLADVSYLGEKQWESLRNYVSAGGTLITLLGPNTDPAAMSTEAATAVLPANGIDKKMKLAKPTPAAMPDFDKNISQVLTTWHRHDPAPFIDRENVYQHYSLKGRDLPPNTTVLIRLRGTGAPLLFERQLGAGRSLMMTTAGLGDWSEWSSLATHPALVFVMTTTYNPATRWAHQFTLDQAATLTVPPAFRGGSVAVNLPDGRGQETLAIDATTGAVALPTRFLGHYHGELRTSAGAKQPLVYAVNFDPTEYALAKIDAKELAEAFPSGVLTLLKDPADAARRGGSGGLAEREEVAALIGLALLLLLVGESFFSNRFYRAAAPPNAERRTHPPSRARTG